MMQSMRTTVTLDPDTHRLVQRAMRAGGGTFKQVVNAAIRRGLLPVADAPDRPPFVLEARPMGLRMTDPQELRKLDDDAEVSRFVRVTRGIEQGRV